MEKREENMYLSETQLASEYFNIISETRFAREKTEYEYLYFFLHKCLDDLLTLVRSYMSSYTVPTRKERACLYIHNSQCKLIHRWR